MRHDRNDRCISINRCKLALSNSSAVPGWLCLSGVLLFLLVLHDSPALSQQIGQNKGNAPSSGFTISVKSQLVVEAVVVKDGKGATISGLSAKDFSLTEDGAPQTIRIFEHQDLSTTQSLLPELKTSEGELQSYKQLTRVQITPESQGQEHYKNHRLLALYFDMSAMRPADQMRALTAAGQFLRTQMMTTDLVSIMRYQGGAVDILEDFSADRNRLLSILRTMIVGEGQGSVETIDDASSADTGSAFGQDDSEFNVFNTDRQLAALQTAAKILGSVSEKKSLIYFSGGLRLNGTDNQAQLHATVDTAIRAGVSFWPIDTRGLVAAAPLGDASQGSPGNASMYTGASALAVTNNFQQSQDTLYALAGDTGGKALFDSNDLARGIVQAQRSVSDYYILGYYTTNPAENGRFRHVRVSLTPDLGAKLSYREGYFADKSFGQFTAADKERQLEDALMLENPITDLSIAMEIDHFQLNRAEYFVPIIVKIPGSELSLAKRGGADHALIDFVGEIKEVDGGITVSNVRDNVNVKLTDSNVAELAKRPIEYDTGFTLLPGKYRIKFLARDDATGKIGTYETLFTIPNLNDETRRIATSSVVLASQQVDLKDALFTVGNRKAQLDQTVNPLVVDGKKLIPSVTRVFRTDKQMFVYFQAYQQQDGEDDNVRQPVHFHPYYAFVSLLRGDSKKFETAPILVTPSASGHIGVSQFSFSFALSDLAKGEYDCQVTVLDPTTGKTSFWRSPVVLVE